MGEASAEQLVTPSDHTTQQEPASGGRPAVQASDITIASAVARAVRMVPGVVDLSPGFITLRATYGSGERVTGVVVHHLAPDKVVLEIHVCLSEAHCNAAGSGTGKRGDASDSQSVDKVDALHGIATHVRDIVYAAMRDVPSPTVERADVLIDDLR